MGRTTYFTQGWDYATANPEAVCPDFPLLADPTAPKWAEEFWYDGFLAQRETAYKRAVAIEAKADDCYPSEADKRKKQKP